MKVLLSDEQIAELYKNRKYLCFEPDITRSNMVAEAQLKAVIKWLDEPCTKHGVVYISRRFCSECWKELQDELCD